MERILFFIVFMVFVIIMLALDLGVFHKKDHVIGIKESAIWTCVWIALSLVLALVIRLHGEWIHGIGSMDELILFAQGSDWADKINPAMPYAEALEIYRKECSSEYLAGYFLEKTLSIDNIFVMIMIFASFGIDKKYYHRVLFWGILGAIVLRFIFIFALGALVSKFSWILAVFGAMLLVSGIKMFVKKDEEEMDSSKHPVVRFCSKHFRATTEVTNHNFFVKKDGKRYMTPLFICLLVIEFSDVIFAVDSIPAVFGVTRDPFIVFFSNIFAIMGLRSLFFLMSDVNDKFWMLKYALGLLLLFIGGKMIVGEFFHLHIGPNVSLFIILGILVFGIVGSLLFPKKEEPNATPQAE